jgi:predicted PurR-regulated permease PerM
MERKGLSRGFASFFCVLVFVFVVAGIIALLSWQISDLAEDMGKMQENVCKSVAKLKENISNTLGISPEKQQQMLKGTTIFRIRRCR